MPLKSSSRSSSNSDRGVRKVRVDTSKSKGSGDGVRTLDSKRKTTDRAHGKKEGASVRSKTSTDRVRGEERSTGGIGKSKQFSDGGKKSEWKEKMIKKVHSRGNGSHADADEKSRGRGLRGLKMKGGKEGYEAVVDGDGGRKRKRVYAGAGVADGGLYEKTFDRKYVSKPRSNMAEPYSDNLKNRVRRNVRGRSDKPRPVRVRLGFRTMKKTDRGNGLLLKRTDTDESKRGIDDYPDRPRRNKSLATKSELIEDLEKRKKRIIRIDPYDISQKRLDDSVPNGGNDQGNKDLSETKEVEMSKNAQFRAIIPSPSILSFVDENLLGRRREIEFKRAGYNIDLSAPLDNIPFSMSSERERVEVPAFRNKLEFFAAAKISSSFPTPDLPEIAFAGRSNVGKSSLLNSLTRQWGVVRTSDKPGLTQTINFFKLGPKMSLVDLPGYGFAFAKDEVKEAWEELVKEYVSTRVTLKRVCLLVDTKWGLKPRDHELIDLMERSQTKYQIVLTKTDLVFPIDVARRAMQIEEKLKAKKSAVQPLMMVSSKSGAGIRSLRTALANIVRFAKR